MKQVGVMLVPSNKAPKALEPTKPMLLLTTRSRWASFRRRPSEHISVRSRRLLHVEVVDLDRTERLG